MTQPFTPRAHNLRVRLIQTARSAQTSTLQASSAHGCLCCQTNQKKEVKAVRNITDPRVVKHVLFVFTLSFKCEVVEDPRLSNSSAFRLYLGTS
eukprot:5868057-Amphidinium_carterae.1